MKRLVPNAGRVFALCAAAALCVGLGATASAQPQPAESDRPAMHVQATGTARAAPDTLRVVFRVVTTHANPQQALDANARALNGAREAVERSRLEDGAVTTGGMTIRAERNQVQRDGRIEVGDIVRYAVSSELHVRTSKLDLAGEIILSAVNAGVNEIDLVEFTVADQDALRREAIADAAKRAMLDAAALARASGQHLGAPRQMRLFGSDVRPFRNEAHAVAFRMGDAGVAPEFAPGLVTAHVTLEVQYDIESMERRPHTPNR